jgi:hypothetical protein
MAQNLFSGIAVVIDDELETPRALIRDIVSQIEQQSCPVIKFTSLPDDHVTSNLSAASFFIVDWNLKTNAVQAAAGEGGENIRLPERLNKKNTKDNIEFLKKLSQIKFAPIFIFTEEPVDPIRAQLKNAGLMTDEGANHIFVKQKSEVKENGVFQVLSNWLLEVPSAYVLKQWEREYNIAKNGFFIDFYTQSHNWPIVLWKAYESDGVSPSVEVGALIGRNVLSRMTPFNFSLETHVKNYDDQAGTRDPNDSKTHVEKVLSGERFIPAGRLHDQSIAPGDLFKKGDKYYLNIRPDCDCIARDGAAQDTIDLYLIKGSKWTKKAVIENFNRQYGNLQEKDNEAVVFGVIDGTTISFNFKDLVIQPWGAWKTSRKGRLLSPYLTRVQQRYAAYLQRPGLSRIPEHLIPLPATVGDGLPAVARDPDRPPAQDDAPAAKRAEQSVKSDNVTKLDSQRKKNATAAKKPPAKKTTTARTAPANKTSR